MKTLLLLIALTVPCFAQCDTIAPSGKLLHRGSQWNRHELQISLDSAWTPCTVVKEFGCPTCGCERVSKNKAADSLRGGIDDLMHLLRFKKDSAEMWAYVLWLAGTQYSVVARQNTCSECGTLYVGRRRK